MADESDANGHLILDAARNTARRHLYPRIANASLDQPKNFAKSVLAILRDIFPIKAVSLYTYSAKQKVLILRGQSGLSYSLYRSFTIPLETPAGDAIIAEATKSFPDVRKESRYVDRRLIDAFGLQSLVAVPLIASSDGVAASPNPLGVICAYPERAGDLAEVAEQLTEICPFIAKLYIAALDHLKMRIRRDFVDHVGHSHDMGSIMYRSVRLFRDLLQVEAASIFLVDARKKFLRMKGTTGLTAGSLMEQFYYSPASKDPTYHAFSTQEAIEDRCENLPFEAPIPEHTATARDQCVIFPIGEPSSRLRSFPIGVLRAFNPKLNHDSVIHTTVFGWEELALVEFYTEMIAVLVHFMRKGMIAENDFERRMHGAKNNLQASIFELQLLERHGGLEVPEALQFSLSNAISFLTDIRSQIHRLELRDKKLESVAVELYGEVLAKIPPIINQSARANKLGTFAITRLDEAGFNKIPKVKGDRAALLAIFRNLAENAVKYCRMDGSQNRIEFSYTVEKESVCISITDFGIGIPSHQAKMLFIDGFRTEDAIKRYPAGTGVGLCDCKELMKRMEGNINFFPGDVGTTFQVHIPLFE